MTEEATTAKYEQDGFELIKIGTMFFPSFERHFQHFSANIEGYQQPQRDYALSFVKNWDLAIDLGANVGIFARHFAAHFKSVLAVEPLAVNIACLKRNMPDNVELLKVAVGDAPCKVQIFVTPNSTGGSFISDHAEVPVPDFFDDEYKAMSGLEEVDLITIDSLNLPSVGLIKLDIQGSELIALKGAAETIQRCRPVVLIEEKPIGGYEANIAHIAEAAAFLNTLGMIPKDKVGADRTYIYE